MCKLHMLKDSHWAPCFWINPQPLHCCTVRIVLSSLFSHRLTLWISSFKRNIGVKWSLSVIVSSSANLILIYNFLIGSSWPYLNFGQILFHLFLFFSMLTCSALCLLLPQHERNKNKNWFFGSIAKRQTTPRAVQVVSSPLSIVLQDRSCRKGRGDRDPFRCWLTV